MPETIETFVEKLQKEGVEAGRAEARKLIEQAQAQAQRVLAEARTEAQRIQEQARAQAEQTLQRGRGELELAARDVLLRLREAVVAALREVLRRGAGEALSDPQFLVGLLRDVVVQYARADAEGSPPVEIRVNEEMLQAVTNWALKEMAQRGQDGQRRIDLKGRLHSAGFEYTADGGVVEVTPDSIADALGEMVAPGLREMILQAAQGQRK